MGGQAALRTFESLELLALGMCAAPLPVLCCYCQLGMVFVSVYKYSYAPGSFWRKTKQQPLTFVVGLNAEPCSLLALFNFGRALKMTLVYAAFPEQTLRGRLGQSTRMCFYGHKRRCGNASASELPSTLAGPAHISCPVPSC